MALLTNDIYVGSVSDPIYHFENLQIEANTTKGVFALDVIGNELSVDQFSVTIRWTESDMLDGFITVDDETFVLSTGDNLFVSKREGTSPNLRDFMAELPYGTPVWWYVGGEFYSKGYLKSVDRLSKNGFRVTCVSGVGLLDTDTHKGGLYQAASFVSVLSDIVSGAFSYTVSQAVQDTARVYGRLPYDTRRKNLHRLLFASGAALMRGTSSNDYVIDYLPNAVTDVPSNRVSLQGSVAYQLPSNRAEITEHAFFYLPDSPTETLFDNTSETAADHLTVVFDSAVYVDSLATTGTLTIEDSGVNYAVVSGLGTLTGQYYTHTTQIDVLENNPSNDPIRVRRVTDNELVTALNARNVARRILSYFQSSKTVKAKILTQGERCGQLLRFVDSFGELTQAYLTKADTLVTTVIGAQCQLVEGFVPSNNGNNFLHRQVIAASGAWTVPAGVTFVRIALIGGGQGGQGGYDGEKGAGGRKGTSIWDPGDPDGELISGTRGEEFLYVYPYGEQRIPAGGEPGNPGEQAKVYVIERSVTPGEIVTFAIGIGGSGGESNGGVGAYGTATSVSSASIGSASSEQGVASQGYFDPFNGDVFATIGANGVRGGDGGRTDTISLYANNGGDGLPGNPCGIYKGGNGGVGYIETGEYQGMKRRVSGGGGGGGAYGVPGGAGGNGVYIPSHWDEEYYFGPVFITGDGGKGADALPPPKPTYGNGGGGGNGGGAGGNIGAGGIYGYDFTPPTTLRLGTRGAPGSGSIGGAGGDGVAIIYW